MPASVEKTRLHPSKVQIRVPTGEVVMSEENVVALKWLISSLETRIIDLEAGRLDECLEDLAKNPIPEQYRSLCRELKCTFPSISTVPEFPNSAAATATATAATSAVPQPISTVTNKTAVDAINGIILPSTHPSSSSSDRPVIKPVASVENYLKISATISSSAPLPVTISQPSPIDQSSRKRKLSICDDEIVKDVQIITTGPKLEGAELNGINFNSKLSSPEKGRKPAVNAINILNSDGLKANSNGTLIQKQSGELNENDFIYFLIFYILHFNDASVLNNMHCLRSIFFIINLFFPLYFLKRNFH